MLKANPTANNLKRMAECNSKNTGDQRSCKSSKERIHGPEEALLEEGIVGVVEGRENYFSPNCGAKTLPHVPARVLQHAFDLAAE